MVADEDHVDAGELAPEGPQVGGLLATATARAATGFAVLDDDHRIVGANATFAAMVGIDLEALVGTEHEDLLHPDDRLRVHDAIDGIESANPFASIVARYGATSESVAHVRIVATISADGGGERRLLLQTLPVAVAPGSDAIFRQVFERAPIPQATIAVDSTVMHVNDAACELVGYTEQELLGRSFVDVIDDDSIRTATEAFQTLLAGSARTVRTEVRLRRSDGAIRQTEAYASAVVDDTGAPLYFFVLVQDVTEQRQRQQQIWHLAVHDALTELPNRAFFLERLGQAVARGRREQSNLAVFFLDLDGFKEVNDELGHDSGDQVLFAAAGRMSRVLRPGDTLARYGGDEFTILCEDIPGAAEVREIAERILSVLHQPFLVVGGHAKIDASIGVALADAGSHAPPALLDAADAAMYASKQSGGGTYRITTL